MTPLTLQFDVTPVAKARPRFRRTPHGVSTYNTKETDDFEHLIAMSSVSQMRGKKRFEGAIGVTIVFELLRPKTYPKREYPTSRPDLDNYIKGVLDGMNEVVFRDDAQIIHLIASKIYADKPGIVVTVIPMLEKGKP